MVEHDDRLPEHPVALLRVAQQVGGVQQLDVTRLVARGSQGMRPMSIKLEVVISQRPSGSGIGSSTEAQDASNSDAAMTPDSFSNFNCMSFSSDASNARWEPDYRLRCLQEIQLPAGVIIL